MKTRIARFFFATLAVSALVSAQPAPSRTSAAESKDPKCCCCKDDAKCCTAGADCCGGKDSCCKDGADCCKDGSSCCKSGK